MRQSNRVLMVMFGWVLSSQALPEELTEYQLPPAVLKAFRADFPGAVEVEYEVEKERGVKVYEIEFRQDDLKREVEYDQNGQRLKDENEDKEEKDEKAGDDD
jgi:antibiotic biosynthesis monooxygenase (ABM) superfamily enzyme